MFDTGFIITLVVSCISSGALVIATTLASEKLGGTFGGWLLFLVFCCWVFLFEFF